MNDKLKKELIVVHTLQNGATVTSISNHHFLFSDGTRMETQHPDITKLFTLSRVVQNHGEIKGMRVIEVQMEISPEQQSLLQDLSSLVDLVVIPFPVLVSLREQNIRHLFKNCVAFNATQATQRLPPEQKIIDINNWSW